MKTNVPLPVITKVLERICRSKYHIHLTECTSPGVLLKCDADHPFFDGQVCQKDASKCCSCKLYCTMDDIAHFIADPVDCTNRYFCLEPGVSENSQPCEDGNVIDPVSESCSDSVHCDPVCPGEHDYYPKCPQRCTQAFYYCEYGDLGEIAEECQCQEDQVFHLDVGSTVLTRQSVLTLPSSTIEANSHSVKITFTALYVKVLVLPVKDKHDDNFLLIQDIEICLY